MRKTRLSFKEKMDLNSGAVYIFSQGDTGICRWTDGKFWTPSRFQDGFLVYWELETTPCDSSGNGRPLSAQSADLGMDTIATKNQKRYRIKQGGLIKKAISIETPYYGTLQLVSYFTELDVSLGLLRSPTSFVV
ncbi:Gluconate transport-inducing protein required for gluconate-H+ symport [Entomophthora muscae]|uniref:Gluconate transport-inducing protein required for gluconate-H+ symport n=1 Tax=Entomophthora muscae TaxID=34485 RepID=A0ACC2UR81_9FUNG|nr:Gluconate transport-inducing protein required for gluconate-H+ symport [Entomophthora muscae]